MSNFFISLLFSIGASTWVYSQMMRRSGSQTQRSLIVTGISFAVIFLVMFLLLTLIF